MHDCIDSSSSCHGVRCPYCLPTRQLTEDIPMNKTWLVTGSSSGIGKALVEQLLERGDCVAATLRKTEVLKDLAERYPEQLWLAQLDVNDATAIRKVVKQAFTELGRIDVVVSSAG